MRSPGAGDTPSLSAVAILVAAGRGLRSGSPVPKQFRPLGGTPLLALSLRPFAACTEIRRAILVVPDPEEARRRLSGWLPSGMSIDFARGGETRQASTCAGLEAAKGASLVLVHDGVRPFITPDLIRRVLSGAARHGAAVPLLPVQETLKNVSPEGRVLGTAPRGEFALAQTPQGFRREILEAALRQAASEGYEGTDEAELVERLGHTVARVEGLRDNLKITTPGDFLVAEAILARESGLAARGVRVGIGYDVHPLVPGRRLVLGGVEIPHSHGPGGHSDGDLVCHAATDAILGAAGLPDIGQLFPDSDPAFKDASSLGLLASAGARIREAGFTLGNLDLVVVAEEPLLSPHIAAMRERIGQALGCAPDRIGIKGKRGEGLGFEGRKEGMAAHAVALLMAGGEARKA